MRRELSGRKERRCMFKDEEALKWRCIVIGRVSWHLQGKDGSVHAIQG